MERWIALATIAMACRSRSPLDETTCVEVADHVKLLLGPNDEHGTKIGDAFLSRCTDDRWPEEAKACIVHTQTIVSPQHCGQKLAPAQRVALNDAIAAVDSTLPAECLRYQHLLDRVDKCGTLPVAVRNDLRAKLAAAQAGWAKLIDKGEAASACANAVRSVGQAVAVECPGITKEDP